MGTAFASESAPTSPHPNLSNEAHHGNKENDSEPGRKQTSSDYTHYIMPVLSSSAPEREGVWFEVKRKSLERPPKAVVPAAAKHDVSIVGHLIVRLKYVNVKEELSLEILSLI